MGAQDTFIDGIYYPGRTPYGVASARLQLHDDAKLSLTMAVGTPEEPANVELFNVPISDILGVHVVVNKITFKMQSGSYSFEVPVADISRMITSDGTLSLEKSQNTPHSQMMTSLFSLLNSNGVKVTKLKQSTITASAAAAIVLVISIAAAVTFLF